MNKTYILTAEMDAESFDWLDALDAVAETTPTDALLKIDQDH